MSKTFKSIWNVLTTIMVAIVVVIAFLLAGVRLFGFDVFTVLSGSMEPTYHVGSLIYVRDIEDKKAIPDGTPITYMINEDTVVTHRTVAPVPDEDDPSVIRYRTKGDANDMEDGTLVHYKNIIGTPVFTIPYLGYLANYIQNPPGSYMTICFGAVFILMLFLPELLGVFLEKEGEEKPVPEKKSRREKKGAAPKKAAAEKPSRKKHRALPTEEDDFFYEQQPPETAARGEARYYDEAEAEPEAPEYEDPELTEYAEPLPDAPAPRKAAEEDWLAALLADVDLDDAGWPEERGASDVRRDRKGRGGSHMN